MTNFQDIVSKIFSKDVPDETCSFTSHCPITNPGSYPECGRVDTGGVTTLCAGESPYFGGGSFTFTAPMGGDIYSIVVNNNRENYCTEPKGVGTNTFSVHCGCDGGCLIEGQWTVFWHMPQEAANDLILG